jgi:hypothetical protein
MRLLTRLAAASFKLQYLCSWVPICGFNFQINPMPDEE